MGYIPIQMGADSLNGFGRGLDSIDNALDSRRASEEHRARMLQDKQYRDAALKLEAEHYAKEQGRLKTQDFQSAYMKARELHAAGDTEGAKALLAPYVTGMRSVDVERPVAPQFMQDQQAAAQGPQMPPAQGGSAMPDGVDHGRSVAAMQAPTQPGPMNSDPEAETRGPMGGMPAPATPGIHPEVAKYFAGMDPARMAAQMGVQAPPSPTATDAGPPPMQQAPQRPQMPPPGPMAQPGDSDALPPQAPPGAQMAPPQAPANPIMAARQQEQAKAQEQDGFRARKLLQFTDPTGQNLSLDPLAGEFATKEKQGAMRAENAHVFHEVIQGMDPKLRPYAEEMRPAIEMSTEPVKPEAILSYLRTRIDADSSGEDRKLLREQALAQQAELTKMRLAQSDINNRRSAAAGISGARIRAIPEVRVAGANRSDTTALEGAFKNWETSVDWKKTLGSRRVLESAATNISSGNPLAEKDAQIQLARFYRQSIPSEGEMHLLYNDLAGKLGDGLPQFMERMNRGGLDPAQKKILDDSIKIAYGESDKQINHIVKSAHTRFKGYEGMQGNVNDMVGAAFEAYGVKAPPVFDTEGTRVQLGIPAAQDQLKGPRGVQAPRAPTAKPAANTADLGAVGWAKAHRNDPRAAEILRVNGVKD